MPFTPVQCRINTHFQMTKFTLPLFDVQFHFACELQSFRHFAKDNEWADIRETNKPATKLSFEMFAKWRAKDKYTRDAHRLNENNKLNVSSTQTQNAVNTNAMLSKMSSQIVTEMLIDNGNIPNQQ